MCLLHVCGFCVCVCAVHMISLNNWYETPLLPTEFADASWRNKALLLHRNVSAQRVCVTPRDGGGGDLIIYRFIAVLTWTTFSHLIRNQNPARFCTGFCMSTVICFVCLWMRQCIMAELSVLLHLLFITLYPTNVLVSVTSALLQHCDGPEQATGMQHDESQWKRCQLVSWAPAAHWSVTGSHNRWWHTHMFMYIIHTEYFFTFLQSSPVP